MTITKTRAKSTENLVKKLDSQLQCYITSNDAKMEDMNKKLDLPVDKRIPNQDRILGHASARNLVEGSGNRSRMGEQCDNSLGRTQSNNHNQRVKFTYFEEGYSRTWLRKCERYFHFNHVTDPQQKLEMAVIHLNGKAESWFYYYHLSKGTVRWTDFTKKNYVRFIEYDNSHLNLLGQFKRIE